MDLSLESLALPDLVFEDQVLYSTESPMSLVYGLQHLTHRINLDAVHGGIDRLDAARLCDFVIQMKLVIPQLEANHG
jgi:hypothetical protein